MSSYDRHYLSMAFPAALEGLFMILLASTDLILVSTLGALSVAAISIFLQPRLILLCLPRSLSSAVTLSVAKLTGQHDREGISSFLKKSLFLCAVVMGFLHVLFFIYLEDIFYLMGATDDYMGRALEYGRLALPSVYFTSLSLILQGVQLGNGDTARIMKTNVAGNGLNACLSFLLIFGAGPIPALGVAGAALGTVAGTFFILIRAFYLLKKDGYFQGGSFLPDAAYFKTMIPLFSSILSEQGSERIGMVLFSRMAAGLGTVPFAVHSICMNICDIYYDFIMGFGKASMVESGQSLGRKNKKDWLRYKRAGLKWILILSAFAFFVIVIFRREIFSFYSSDPASLALSGPVMMIVALVSYPEAIAIWGAGILRGSGKTAQVAVYSFVSITFLRPLITAFFLYVLDLGLMGAWYALFIDQAIRACSAAFLLSRIRISGPPAGKASFLAGESGSGE